MSSQPQSTFSKLFQKVTAEFSRVALEMAQEVGGNVKMAAEMAAESGVKKAKNIANEFLRVASKTSADVRMAFGIATMMGAEKFEQRFPKAAALIRQEWIKALSFSRPHITGAIMRVQMANPYVKIVSGTLGTCLSPVPGDSVIHVPIAIDGLKHVWGHFNGRHRRNSIANSLEALSMLNATTAENQKIVTDLNPYSFPRLK